MSAAEFYPPAHRGGTTRETAACGHDGSVIVAARKTYLVVTRKELLLVLDNTKLIRSIRREQDTTLQSAKREDFVRKNMGLVYKIAHQYKCETCPTEDAVQEGCFGLLKALDDFDSQCGVQFSTYAYYWIRQSLQTKNAKSKRSHSHSRLHAGTPLR